MYFFFVLIPLIWLGFSYRWGIRLFYWLSFNSVMIHLLKYWIGWPRPSTEMPELGMLHPSTTGFPSGGAESSLFLGGLLIYYWRTNLAWIIGITYMLLISFSRLYLGVHYPIDLLGGWILGFIMLGLLVKTRAPLERWLEQKGLRFCLLLSLALPLGVMFAVRKPAISFTMGACVGIGLGTYFSLKHQWFLPKPKTINEGLGRASIGIAILFAVLFVFPGGLHFAKALTAALFMSLGASPIAQWLMKTKIH